jgi:hypothetical protein
MEIFLLARLFNVADIPAAPHRFLKIQYHIDSLDPYLEHQSLSMVGVVACASGR